VNIASAIVEGLKVRGQAIRASAIHAITTADFPTKAVRPANSRLDLSRLRKVFDITTPSWQHDLGRTRCPRSAWQKRLIIAEPLVMFLIAASDQAIRRALEPRLHLGLGPIMVNRRKPCVYEISTGRSR
jgi:hypothetical protein